MKPRHRAMLPALVGLLAALGPRAAHAAERGCTALAVESDAEFRGRFPDLLERIQSELSARADLDDCARVQLRVQEASVIRVSVTLPDGRAASRSVARRDDVVPTLQALLLVPERAPFTTATTAAATATTDTTPPAPSVARRTRRVAPTFRAGRDVTSPLPQAQRQFGFELSAVSGVRIGDGQFAYGVGVFSFLEVKRWLLGFQGRADGYRSLQGSDPETALELAILVGRRLDLGSVALDLTAGPAIAMKGLALSETHTAAVSEMPSTEAPSLEPSNEPVPRLLLGARLGFSPRSVFRTFIGIDAELGPTHAPVTPISNPSSARMPAYTVGLALGATVGTP